MLDKIPLRKLLMGKKKCERGLLWPSSKLFKIHTFLDLKYLLIPRASGMSQDSTVVNRTRLSAYNEVFQCSASLLPHILNYLEPLWAKLLLREDLLYVAVAPKLYNLDI